MRFHEFLSSDKNSFWHEICLWKKIIALKNYIILPNIAVHYYCKKIKSLMVFLLISIISGLFGDQIKTVARNNFSWKLITVHCWRFKGIQEEKLLSPTSCCIIMNYYLDKTLQFQYLNFVNKCFWSWLIDLISIYLLPILILFVWMDAFLRKDSGNR